MFLAGWLHRWVISRWGSFGARAVRPVRRGAGCDGYAGAHSATAGRTSRPRRPPMEPPWEPLAGLQGLTAQGLPFGTLRAAICVPLRAAAIRMMWTGEGWTPQARPALCLSAVTGSAPLLALCPETVTASLLDLEPSRSPSRRRSPAPGMRMAPPTSRRNRRRPNFAHHGASGITCTPPTADVLRLTLAPHQRPGRPRMTRVRVLCEWVAGLGATGARERPAAHGGVHGARDLVAVDGTAELQSERHRVLDIGLPGGAVAGDLAVVDVDRAAFGRHRARQRPARALQVERRLALPDRRLHDQVPGACRGHRLILLMGPLPSWS